MNQEVEFRARQFAAVDAAVEKVAELRELLEWLFDRKERQTVSALIESDNLSAFAPAPFKELPLHGTRNRKCKMRFPLVQLTGTQKLEEETERLLCDVFFRKGRLVFRDKADAAMQHRNKREDEKAFNELGL